GTQLGSSQPVNGSSREHAKSLPSAIRQEGNFRRWLTMPLRWGAILLLLLFLWGAIQFLALLIQAERLRAAIESGLNTATLPESTKLSVTHKTEQAIHSILGDAPRAGRYYLNGRPQQLPFSTAI